MSRGETTNKVSLGMSGKGYISSPQPMPRARPPKRKNGTSAPREAAISINLGAGIVRRVSCKYPCSAAAASLEPPPRPRPAGLSAPNGETNTGSLGGAQAQIIVKGNGLKDGAEFVVGVRALAENVQPEINFREGWDSDFAHALLRLGFLDGRFLSYAMLGLAEFLLDFSDLVVLDVGGQSMTPFRERFFPLGGGELIAAELGVDVAEV